MTKRDKRDKAFSHITSVEYYLQIISIIYNIIYILYIIGSFLPIWSIQQNVVTLVTLSRLRSEFESEESGCGVGLYQLEAATTLLHYLARDAKSDAAACGLGGEERDEDLLCLLGGNGVAVVTDVDNDRVVGSGVS